MKNILKISSVCLLPLLASFSTAEASEVELTDAAEAVLQTSRQSTKIPASIEIVEARGNIVLKAAELRIRIIANNGDFVEFALKGDRYYPMSVPPVDFVPARIEVRDGDQIVRSLVADESRLANLGGKIYLHQNPTVSYATLSSAKKLYVIGEKERATAVLERTYEKYSHMKIQGDDFGIRAKRLMNAASPVERSQAIAMELELQRLEQLEKFGPHVKLSTSFIHVARFPKIPPGVKAGGWIGLGIAVSMAASAVIDAASDDDRVEVDTTKTIKKHRPGEPVIIDHHSVLAD